MIIIAATSNEAPRVFVSILCSSPHGTAWHHEVTTCSRPHIGEKGSGLPFSICILAQGQLTRGTNAPQRGHGSLSACRVSSGAGGGMVVAAAAVKAVSTEVWDFGKMPQKLQRTKNV